MLEEAFCIPVIQDPTCAKITETGFVILTGKKPSFTENTGNEVARKNWYPTGYILLDGDPRGEI